MMPDDAIVLMSSSKDILNLQIRLSVADIVLVLVFIIIYSDSSGQACGAVLNIDNKVFYNNWTEDEGKKNSTRRELKAVHLGLHAFKLDLLNRTVDWRTDNQNVVSIVPRGSRVPELQSITLQLFNICLQYNLSSLDLTSLDAKWIPRVFNTRVHHRLISKIVGHDDYTINDHVFAKLDYIWGLHTVDRFACSYMQQQIATIQFQIRTEGVDAITQNWRYTNNWLFSPTVLIPRIISHLQACIVKLRAR